MQKYAIIRKNTKYIYIFYHSKRKSNYIGNKNTQIFVKQTNFPFKTFGGVKGKQYLCTRLKATSILST